MSHPPSLPRGWPLSASGASWQEARPALSWMRTLLSWQYGYTPPHDGRSPVPRAPAGLADGAGQRLLSDGVRLPDGGDSAVLPAYTLWLVKRAWWVARRSVVSFYDDQATHHAAALTYYALMSLFPLLLLAVSLLGVLGEFPSTYNAIVGHLHGVVPAVTLAPLTAAVKAALKDRGTAAAALALAVATALYGGTGYLEAVRRALNVVFEAQHGRSFVRRKLTDVASLFVLLALLLTTLVLVFAAGGVARRVLGPEAASVWRIARWPGAFASALLVFSFIYYVTPDVRHRAFRWIMPGAFAGVAVWLTASAAFSEYLANFKSFNVTYGSFAAAIILLVWLWLTNLALLLGAEINAQIERANEIAEGTPERETLNLPPAH